MNYEKIIQKHIYMLEQWLYFFSFKSVIKEKKFLQLEAIPSDSHSYNSLVFIYYHVNRGVITLLPIY